LPQQFPYLIPVRPVRVFFHEFFYVFVNNLHINNEKEITKFSVHKTSYNQQVNRKTLDITIISFPQM
jgi:hypothetical protein